MASRVTVRPGRERFRSILPVALVVLSYLAMAQTNFNDKYSAHTDETHALLDAWFVPEKAKALWGVLGVVAVHDLNATPKQAFSQRDCTKDESAKDYLSSHKTMIVTVEAA